MQIGVVGVHFRSVPVAVREKISKKAQLLPMPLVCLSTCNRVEIYFSGPDLLKLQGQILFHLGTSPLFYHFAKQDCFSHLCRVTSGLDSAIFLESEIQRQVKLAYEESHKKFSLPGPLHYLFQKSLKIAKEIRTHFANGRKTASLYQILWELSSLNKNDSILFIGNSEINKRILAHFSLQGRKNIALCTRRPSSAVKLKEQYGCAILDWSKLSNWNEFELVISATKHDGYVIEKGLRGKTKVIFDLGVPRNIHPRLNDFLSLWNIDQIFEWKKQETFDVQEIENAIDFNVEKLIEIYQRKQEVYAIA